LKVNFIAKKDFMGSPTSTPETPGAEDVPPRMIAWGELIQQATKDVVLLFEGGLALPVVT
jgi:hypothetical protein